MATFREIITRTEKLVRSPAAKILIPELINQGVHEIAGGMISNLADIITPPLPELFTIAPVLTDVTSASVAMPENFHRTLQFATNAQGTEIDISHTFIDFSELDPTFSKVGRINEVIEHGKRLYYSYIPAVAEEITLHYYRLPVDMTENDHVPDGIPEQLQMALLSNFAAWKAYEIIEDGLEGETPNTLKYRSFFLEALKTFELTIPDYTRHLRLR